MQLSYYRNPQKKKALITELIYLRNSISLKTIVWINKILLIKGSKEFYISNDIGSGLADDIFYCTYDEYKCPNKTSFVFYQSETNHPFLKSKRQKQTESGFYRIGLEEILRDGFTTSPINSSLKNALIIREIDIKYKETWKEQRHWAESISREKIIFDTYYNTNYPKECPGTKIAPLKISYCDYLSGYSIKYVFYELLFKNEISKISGYSVLPKIQTNE